MNFNAMPDGNSAAELAYDRAGQAAEERHERLAAMYPREEFEDEAIENAFADDCYEIIHSLTDDAPEAVLRGLIDWAGCNEYLDNKALSIDLAPVKALIGRLIKLWIEEEADELQRQFLELVR